LSAVATSAAPTILVDPPATVRSAPRLFEPPDGGARFEDVVLGCWEDLTIAGTAECPVCGGRMHRDSCRDCGSELS
jgi:hypothetical protein